MTAYGYDFHQTTIAKIEAAQRPLRVRELADFAALYGMEVQDLVYPPTRSLPEIEQEIDEVRARLGAAEASAARVKDELEQARAATQAAEAAYQASAAEVAVLAGRLASLSADREKATSWEPDGDPPRPEGSDQGALESTSTSVFPAAGGPTVLRTIVGGQLRRLREAAGITTERAGYAIRASRSKIVRLEAGRVGFKVRDIAELLLLYGVTDEKERQALLILAQRANSPGWWHDYSDILPSWLETYIGLEMAASVMRVYAAQAIPEILQTADYSRAATAWSHAPVSTKENERRVRLRMARQEHFLDRPNPPVLWAVLDESVLQRNVGGPNVMRDQIRHLVEIAGRPNITIQVLPLQAGNHSAEGSFSILRFAEPDLPDVVYLEQLTSAVYLDKPEDVEVYQDFIDSLGARALTPAQTTQFLRDRYL